MGSRWIVSAGYDLGMLAAPVAITLLVLLGTGGGDVEVPLWAFLVLIVAFDVSHVWATLAFTYLDPEVARRRRLLLWLPIPVLFLVAYRIHLHDPILYWTLLAYVAIHHFISQQYGFVALYKLRAGERAALDRHLDKWAVWAGTLGPVLWWHASPERHFDWFGHGEEFALLLPPDLKPDIAAVVLAIGAVYLARQAQLARRGAFNLGKNLWMLATWLAWGIGVGLDLHPLISLACINLLHGIPFLALVWARCQARWRDDPDPPTWIGRVVRRGRWWLAYALLLGLAVLEEGLWDGVVWGQYLERTVGWSRASWSTHATSLWVAALALPQTVHYVLDGWFWTLDGSNPDLHATLGLPLPTRAPATADAPDV